jgi:hypothetical protein
MRVHFFGRKHRNFLMIIFQDGKKFLMAATVAWKSSCGDKGMQ